MITSPNAAHIPPSSSQGDPKRLHLDENLGPEIADRLRARGFDVTTTRDAGLSGSSDARQLAWARRQQRLLITFDRDFLKARHRQAVHAGILVLKFNASSKWVARAVADMLNTTNGQNQPNSPNAKKKKRRRRQPTRNENRTANEPPRYSKESTKPETRKGGTMSRNENSHDVEQNARATEESVPIDSLRERISDSQINVWRYWGTLMAALLSTVLLADMMGNILGLPVFSGPVVHHVLDTATVWGDNEKATVAIVAVSHALLLSITCWFLFRSSWRRLLPELTANDDTDWLATKRIIASVCGAAIALVLVHVMTGQIPLSKGQRPVIAMLVFGAVCSAPLLARVVPRVLAQKDHGTTTGLNIGMVAVFLTLLLFAGQQDIIEAYSHMAWGNGRLILFRYVELILVGLWLGSLRSLCSATADPAVYYRLLSPTTPAECHYALHYNQMTIPGTLAVLDHGELRKTLVLQRKGDGDCRLIDGSRRLVISDFRYEVLHLDAFQERIAGEPVTLSDSGGFVTGQFHFRTNARSARALSSASQETIPAQAVDAVLDGLFNTEDVRDLLVEVLDESLEDILESDGRTSQDYLDEYSSILTQAQVSASRSLTRMARNESGESFQEPLAITRLGTSHLELAYEQIMSAAGELRLAWTGLRRRMQRLRSKLPERFQIRLSDRFVAEVCPDDCDTVSLREMRTGVLRLVRAAGVTVHVDTVGFAEGAAQHCDVMLQKIEQWIEDRVKVHETAMLDRDGQLFTHQLALRQLFLELQKYPHFGLSAELSNRAYALLQSGDPQMPNLVDSSQQLVNADSDSDSDEVIEFAEAEEPFVDF